jgi:aspartate/methionine/tyrosine aminotransferase
MKFKPFLLDQWLQNEAEFHLGGSTGPRWTIRELLALDGLPHAVATRMTDLELRYPPTPGIATLREAIAKLQGVAADEVTVFAGGAEALFHIFFLAAEQTANVIIPSPSFPAHEVVPASLGIEIRHYHLRRERSYAVDIDEVKRLADKNTKILVVNSPHNPTGATLTDTEMQQLHDFAADRGIQFLSDEVFHPIYHDGAERQSAARLPHATVVNDFSKALSLPGLRLAWIIERNAARRHDYLNAREYISVSNTPMGEFLGEIAIRHHEKVLARTRQVTSANLALLGKVIADRAPALDWVRPAGGMTAWVRLANGGDGRKFCEGALRRGLLIAPGDCWGASDHIRVGFGVGDAHTYTRAMERFSEFVDEWSGRAHALAAF